MERLLLNFPRKKITENGVGMTDAVWAIFSSCLSKAAAEPQFSVT